MMGKGMLPTIVKYQGNQIFLRRLANAKGITPSLLRARWNEAGKPDVITEGLILDAQCARNKVTGITYKGHPISIKSLAEFLRMSVWTVHKRVKEHGKDLLPIHLQSRKRQPTINKLEIATFEKGNRAPGFWERENLPNAGKNGFCKVEIVNSYHLGQFTKMPVSE